MRQPCQVASKDPFKAQIGSRKDLAKGFVLLEVLVAMSLILGSWMALVGTYQSLVLRATQMESKRAQLRREFDAFEVSEQLRISIIPNTKGQNHESSRVSSRHRAQHATSQSTSKNQR
jgi:type II secretory pathway component PulJ